MRLLIRAESRYVAAGLIHHLRHHAVLTTGGRTTASLARFPRLSGLSALLLTHRHLLLHLRLQLLGLHLALVQLEVGQVAFLIGATQRGVFGRIHKFHQLRQMLLVVVGGVYRRRSVETIEELRHFAIFLVLTPGVVCAIAALGPM